MALDTYANLKTAIANWLTRSDLTAEIDDFIRLFEAWANRNLRVPQMELESTTPAAEFVALPVDFLQMRDIQWQGPPIVELGYVTPTRADQLNPEHLTGVPKYYSIIAGQIRIIPVPTSSDLLLTYWRQLTALSPTNTSNWLLAAHPDAYLYGALMRGRHRVSDPAAVQMIMQSWAVVMDEIRREGSSGRVGSRLQMNVS